jgi:arylamine N-acetyltransferase
LDPVVLKVHPSTVWEKVRHGTRGTYCFEGNFLLEEALRMIGFEAMLIPVCI